MKREEEGGDGEIKQKMEINVEMKGWKEGDKEREREGDRVNMKSELIIRFIIIAAGAQMQ